MAKKKDFLTKLCEGGIKELKHQDKRIEKGCKKHKKYFK